MQVVGRDIPRIDAVAKVTGRAMFTDDFPEERMLHAALFRSTIGHGRVKSIDTSKASSLPGVSLVVTYEDVPDIPFGTAGHPWNLDPSHRDVEDRKILTGHIRYYGDEIACVVAKTREQARAAAALIEVEYEEYPVLLTAEQALAEDAQEIHEGTKNIIAHTSFNIGDEAAGHEEAAVEYTAEYHTLPVQHAHMELQVSYAYIGEDNKITVVSPTQIPHICRRVVGQALGIPWGNVRIIKPFLGGGFGNRQEVLTEPLVAFLTTKLHGKPVKIEFTREETMLGTRTRHAMDITVKAGFTSWGRITYREFVGYSLNGAYGSHGHALLSNAITKARQLYENQTVKADLTTFYTNMPTAGAMRGYGVPQGVFAMESFLDDAAYDNDWDPVALRLFNFVDLGWTDPITGITLKTCGITKCLRRGAAVFRWGEKRTQYAAQTGDLRRGVGLACFSYASGTWPVNAEVAGARIVMNQDGSIQLMVGATEIGQGSDTALGQIAAEAIGIPMDMVHVISTQDTDVTPFDPGSFASRQTYVSGAAVYKAAIEIREKAIKLAATLLKCQENVLDIVEGQILYTKTGNTLCSLGEVAMNSYYHKELAAPITADVSENVRNNAYAYGVTFAEIEVDIKTGKLTVLDILNVHDAGRIINPVIAEGQVHGGVAMGIGYGVSEQMLFHEKTGQLLNDNLLDFKICTALDVPAEIGVEFIELLDPTSAYGNKALGEPPLVSPAAAIRNAVLHATGVKCNTLPLTPQRLFENFRAAGLV